MFNCENTFYCLLLCKNIKLVFGKHKSYMDACDLFEQNSGLKVKILCMCYVPDSGICMDAILPFVFPFNGFQCNDLQKKRISITSDFGLEFLLASTCKTWIIFFLIFVKTLKFFIVINSCRYIGYSLNNVKFCIWLLSAVWAVIALFICCLFLFLPWQIILSPKKTWIL